VDIFAGDFHSLRI